MALIWPWGVVNPLNPITAIEIFSHFFEKPWRELFDGMLLEPPDMPRSYVPTLLGLKLPELLLLTSAASACWACSSPRSARVQRRATRAVHFAVALAAILPIAATVLTRPAMYNGIRHFVFVLPPLAVAGGLAGAWIVNWIAERAAPVSRAALAALALIFAAGVALPAIGMVRLHPYEYVSFNHIAGGVRGAQSRFMLDYWGLAFKQAGAGASRQARRPRRDAARRRQMEDRGVRPASAGADRARRPVRADLGSERRRLRADARHVLLRAGSTRRSWSTSCATASASRAPTTSAAATIGSLFTEPPVKPD